MTTVSFRVPEELKNRMDEHPEINWSAVLREQITDELDKRRERDLAQAVLTTDRLSGAIDPETEREQDTTEVIHEWREKRYGPQNTDESA